MTTDAVDAVESVGDAGAVRLLERYKRRYAEDVIAAVYEDARRIKRRELEEALGKLEARDDLGDAQRDAVEELADAIVDQLLAAPTENLRHTADWSAIHTALRLFDPESGTTDERPLGGDSDLWEVNDDD